MFYVRDEGEPTRNGFNFYPLKSSHNFGFKLKLGKHVWMIRYNKVSKKFFFVKLPVPKNTWLPEGW